MGTPEFAVESLRALHNSEIEVAAVVTVADKPAGRGRKLQQSAVKQYAESVGLPVLQPLKLKDPDFIEKLSSYNADLFVVVAFRMLPEVVWDMPPMGSINLHGSLLPQYRGAAPIHHAVINGEEKTGCTVFFLRQAIDTGAVVDHCELAIGPNDTTGDIHDQMMVEGAKLLLDCVRRIAKNEVNPTEQERLITTPLKEAPKLTRENTMIDWTESVQEVHNLVRGLSPFPGAWTNLEGEQVKIWRGQKTDKACDQTPGSLVQQSDKLLVACKDAWFSILEIQLPGKKRTPIDAFLRGNQLDGMLFS